MEYIINSIDEINIAAKFILKNFSKSKIFAFFGDMGVGKTTIIKQLCIELGVYEIVNSPSFAIINEYLTKNDDIIYHFDFYRITNVTEAYGLGYEEYFYSNNYCFIEWSEKISSILPNNCVKIQMSEINNGIRKLKIKS